jgi:hypothetical protein
MGRTDIDPSRTGVITLIDTLHNFVNALFARRLDGNPESHVFFLHYTTQCVTTIESCSARKYKAVFAFANNDTVVFRPARLRTAMEMF